MAKLTCELLIEDLTPEERERMERVESVLPTLKERAKQTDKLGEFNPDNVKLFSEAGLLGLVVPKEYGGLGGGIRDWAAACFSIGTICPSTGLAYFFHNTSASRGTLALAGLEAGLYTDEEAPKVKEFAEKVLHFMGTEGKWLANYASESVKSEHSAITISTRATKVEGGWELNGEKSFGCATGIADKYLVTAGIEGIEGGKALATFFVDQKAPGTRGRMVWDSLGMRGTATEGLVLEKVFVPDEEAMAIPGAFARSCQMSRTGFVGNQVAASVIYLGGAVAAYQEAVHNLKTRTFADTGKPLGTGPFQRQLVGDMYADLMTALLWGRRMIQIESSEPPIVSKDEGIRFWRTCKGEIAEKSFSVAQKALKCAGTSGTSFSSPFSRYLRDTAMGLVQAFPAERGRLEAASLIIEGQEQNSFGKG